MGAGTDGGRVCRRTVTSITLNSKSQAGNTPVDR
jgi:hypothetical protein